MNDEKTFEEREDALIATALKDPAFRRSLPPGLAARVSMRVHAVAATSRRSVPRWFKVAAALAAIASFAAFAATVAWLVSTPDAAQSPAAATDESGGAHPAAAEETFEEIFSEELQEISKYKEKQVMNGKAIKGLAAGTLAAAVTFAVPSAQGAVRSSVFDDVKVWYKGAAGNTVGTTDSNSATKVKNLPQLADASSSMHGGEYFWWGWRLQYANQDVECPYAGVSLASTPCLVVPSYASKTGDATVTINGETTTQPYWNSRRFGNLYFTNWMSDWANGTVCSNWTCVLRVRSDQVNQVSGNANHVIDIGSTWNATAGAATGVSLNFNTPTALADYVHPRTFVSTTQKNYEDIQIKNGRWVDCALVVDGQKLTLWLCWNNGTDVAPTNKLVKITETYPTTKGLPTIPAGCRVNLASQKDAYSASFTNGVYNADMGNKAFEGAFHQIAFWDRTLSDDEVRTAMAGGTGRPNLVQVGIEGNGISEFATSAQTASVATDGAWENLNPTLTAENPSATISFTCPALWAGEPQYLRIPMAGTSSSGVLGVTLNGVYLGTVGAFANRTALVFVEAGKILSGANTLVLSRVSGGSLVLDAVTLGGSWRFGQDIGSFAPASETSSLGPDKYVFNPACGTDKFHARGTNAGEGARETSFDFFVPEDMVGKFRGVFATRAQNTSGSAMPYTFHANGEEIGEYTLKGGVTTEVEIPESAIVAGWNRIYWKTTSSGYWVNIDWHKFTVGKPPKGTIIVIR